MFSKLSKKIFIKRYYISFFLLFSLLFTAFLFRGSILEKKRQILKPSRISTEIYTSLRSLNASVRVEAIREIGISKNTLLIPHLREILLKDPSAEVRAQTALTLGTLGDKESSMLIVNRLIEDKDIPKDVLMDAIAKLNDPSIAIHILPILDHDNEIYRIQAVKVLGSLNAKHISKELLSLAQKNIQQQKLKTYVMALGKLEVKEAEDFLLEQSKKIPPSLTLASIYFALGKIKSKKAIPELIRALPGNHSRCRESAANALIQIGPDSYRDSLVSYLFHSNKEIRYLTAKVLAELPQEQISEKILLLLDKKEQKVYGPASFILGKHGYKKSVSKIQQLFQNKLNYGRKDMAIALGRLGSMDSIPLLIESLEKETGEVRYHSATALGFLQSDLSIEALMNSANSKDKKLSILSIESLGQLGSEKSLSFLDQKTQTEPEIALNTLLSIANCPSEKALPILYKHLFSPKTQIQKAAIIALGVRKDQKTLSELVKLLKSDDPEIIRTTLKSLQKISGDDLPTPKDWLQKYGK